MNTEQWRDVDGYEGLYQVSDHGRVKSLKFGKERILKGAMVVGYPTVLLTKVGEKQRTHYVHRLVASAFLTIDSDRLQVNHKDGDRTHNHVSNLEWCTPAENTAHARDVLGRVREKGYTMETNGAIPSMAREKGVEIEQLVVSACDETGSLSGAARMLGVNRNTIKYYLEKFGYEVPKVERYLVKIGDPS